MSIQVPPGRSPPARRPRLSTTAATAAGEGRQVITLSGLRGDLAWASRPRPRPAPSRPAARVALEIVHGEREARPQQAPGEMGAEMAEPTNPSRISLRRSERPVVHFEVQLLAGVGMGAPRPPRRARRRGPGPAGGMT